MSVTTIKVETGLRDRISAAAREHGQTMGDYLDVVVSQARRRERLQAMADAMRSNPPDEEYWAEVAEFDALAAPVHD